MDKEAMGVEKYAQNKITTRCKFWPQAQQHFYYHVKKNRLVAKCSCKTSGDQLCIHIPAALEQIISVYGNAVFDPAYHEHVIQDFLKDYGYSEEDDYHDFFEFSIDEYGLQLTEKIKNIVPSLEEAKKSLLPNLDQKMKDTFLIDRPNTKKIVGILFLSFVVSTAKTYLKN